MASIGLLLFLVLNVINERLNMWDLKVYHGAYEELIQGNSPYGQSFGLSSGFYKYSPTAALLFAPLFVLGWKLSMIIYYVGIGASMVLSLPKLLKDQWHRFSPQMKDNWLPLLLVLLLLGGHLTRELFLGNVNWLLFIGLIFLFKYRNSSPILAGVLFGLLLVFKPHFVFVLPWLLVRKKWKVLLSSGFAFAMLLLLPSLVFGWTQNIQWLKEWLDAMAAHNMDLWESANTIYHVFQELTFGLIPGQVTVVLLLALVAGGILSMIIRHYRGEKTQPQLKSKNEYLEFFLIVGLIPNLVHTDTEHFLWATPMILLFASHVVQSRKWYWWLVFAACAIPFGLATPDLWGRAGAEWLIKSGAIGVANLVMVLSAYFSVKQLRSS
ncbi:MAG: glycosyltransferase family 87 protein [Flavobacteriales bacterium]